MCKTNLNIIEFLEEVQKAYLEKADKPIPIHDEFEEDEYLRNLFLGVLKDNPNKENIVENILKKRNDSTKIPVVPLTKYQDYSHYVTLLNIYEKIENVKDKICELSNVKQPEKKNIYFGTIEDRGFEAKILPCDDDILILVTSGLFNYAFFFSLIVAKMIPIGKIGSIENQTRDNISYILPLFCDLMLFGLFNKKPENVIYSNRNDETEVFALHIYNMFIHYTIAHEYSHFLLNHLNKSNIKLADNWNEELEADCLATNFTICGGGFMTSLISILSFMKSFDFFESFKFISSNKPPSLSETHPLSAMRAETLFKGWELNENEKNVLKEFYRMLDILWDTFIRYIEIIKKHYKDKNKNMFEQNLDDIRKLMYNATKCVENF